MSDLAPPTPGELQLLRLMWQHGPLSLSDVHASLPGEAGYTTVQTRLNRLVDKGWARRFKTGRQPSKYEAVVTRAEVDSRQLASVARQVTRENLAPLVAHWVRDKGITADELKELKAIVKQAEQQLHRQRETP